MGLPSRRNQIFAWSVYDLANTVYSALFITLFFPDFVKNYLGGTETHLGLIVGTSTILSILVVPVVGALSDQVGRRMPFLIVLTVGCCAAVFGVAFSSLKLAVTLAIVSNFFYSIAIAVYDALLPKLAPPEERGSVSGLGTAVGYLGTHISLGAAIVLMQFLGWNTEVGVRGTFVLVAVLFLGFSLYPFVVIREPKTASGRSLREDLRASFASVASTLRGVHRVPGFLPFLAGVFLYGNAIYAVITFLYAFSNETLGLTPQQFVYIYAGMAVAAALGSYAAGKLVDRIGAMRVLLMEGVLWVLVVVSLMFVGNVPTFVVAGCVGGVALGTHWTATRPMLIRFANPSAMGEYFGFLALVNKASGAVGPLVFGPLAAYDYRLGLISLVGFFVVGLVCLALVRRVPGEAAEEG